MARKLEELPIHRNAVEFCCAVTALLDRPAFGRNRKLRDQIDSANDSILSNMSEGFEQPTDEAVEKYLFERKARRQKSWPARKQRNGRVALPPTHPRDARPGAIPSVPGRP